MTPEVVAIMIKTFGGGTTTGILVLAALWLYNRKNGNTKYVPEGICKLHQEALRKDITHVKESVDRVEQLVREGQKSKE